MTVSETINQLKKVMKEHGDLDIGGVVERELVYEIHDCFAFEVKYPDLGNDFSSPVCIFMPGCSQPVIPGKPKRPKLRVVK